MFCEKLDPMEMSAARQWAESPLAIPISESVVENPLSSINPQR